MTKSRSKMGRNGPEEGKSSLYVLSVRTSTTETRKFGIRTLGTYKYHREEQNDVQVPWRGARPSRTRRAYKYDGEGVEEIRAKKITRQQRLYVSTQYYGDRETGHTSHDKRKSSETGTEN